MKAERASTSKSCLTNMVADNLNLHSLPDLREQHICSLYKRFILTAITITLTFGTFWGVSILTKAAVTHSFSAPAPAQIQAHAHAQVFGWIGLLIMGVSYFAYPKIKKTRLKGIGRAEASFWLMTTGIVTRAIAQPFATHAAGGIAVVLSAIMEVLAAGIFVSVMIGTHNRASEQKTIPDMFIFSALAWLIVALILNLFSMVLIARTGDAVIPAALNLSRMHAEVFGFIASMILGMAAYLLPKLLEIREIPRKLGILATVLFAAGVFAKVVAAPAIIGSVLIVAAVLVYIAGFPSLLFTGYVKNKKDPLRPWVKAAFFWLLAGGSMMLCADVYAAVTGQHLPDVWTGSYRHAVAVGFITTMALGVAHRTVPLFHGAPLYSTRLMWIAFALLQTGNACRVIFQIFTVTKNPVIFGITGMSGYIELTALILFGYNILRTLTRPTSQFFREQIVRETTAVKDIYTAFPNVKPALANLGLKCDACDSRAEPRISISYAAKRIGLKPELVVETLNREISRSRSLTTLFT